MSGDSQTINHRQNLTRPPGAARPSEHMAKMEASFGPGTRSCSSVCQSLELERPGHRGVGWLRAVGRSSRNVMKDNQPSPESHPPAGSGSAERTHGEDGSVFRPWHQELLERVPIP